jgi:outer membrane lipoprotein-sorting protein
LPCLISVFFAAFVYAMPAQAEPVKAPLPWVKQGAPSIQKSQMKPASEPLESVTVSPAHIPDDTTTASETAVATLYRVEKYLNSISTIKAHFSQSSPDGTISHGTMYIKRPGKMRWQYAPPTPVLMVANGSTMIYYDHELDQVTHIPIEDTLASLLAKSDLRFTDEALRVINFREGAGMIRFTVLRADKPSEGSIAFELRDKPLAIESLTVVDASAQVVRIQLHDAEYNTPLDKSLFLFKDPRQGQRKKPR